MLKEGVLCAGDLGTTVSGTLLPCLCQPVLQE